MVGANVYADKSRSHVTLLAKVAICPDCGRFLIGNYRKREDRLMAYYRCGNMRGERTSFAMPLLDTAVWSFCKSNWETYLDFLKKASGTDTTEIESRITNIEATIERIEAERDEYLEQVLSLGRMSAKLQAKVKEKVDDYNEQVADLKSSILKERETLETIRHMSDLSDSEIALERSKSEMRKYIQILVSTVLPIYKTMTSYIIEVKLNDGIVVPYTTETDAVVEGLPVYLIADKISGISPKLRCIYSPDVMLDKENGVFHFGDKEISIKDVFADKEDTFSRELLFRRLKIYDDDVPKNK
jgi:hypothetical protein